MQLIYLLLCYSTLNLLDEEVSSLNISVLMRIEVYLLRHVCTSPSPQANEPVNRLTPERSGSPNKNLQNNVVPLQLWHVYQWTKQS